jgi:hypothetical protein
MVLLPTLFITVSLGCIGWATAVAWFLVARYTVEKVWGKGESQALVPVKKTNKGRQTWESSNGTRTGGEKGVLEKVKEVVSDCEDVDCVGMMGGGMELGCG